MGLAPSFEPDIPRGQQTSTSTVPYNPASLPPTRPRLYLPVRPELANYISQYFGPTDETLDTGAFGYPHFNKGIDWYSPDGKPFEVFSASEGVVVAVGDQKDGWGNSIKVRMPDGRIVNYGHLSSANVSVGQRVQPGQVLGWSGSTGASTGVHLSFDILEPDGTPVDPSQYFGVNLARDNRRGGGRAAGSGPLTAPQVTGRQRSQLVAQRDYLLQLRNELMSQDPGGSASAIAEITKMIIDLDQAVWEIDTYGYPGYQTWAKDAITSKINLGDFELRKAGQVFSEWLNKNAAAMSAAVNQLQQAKQWNDMVAQSEKDYAFTRMKLPAVLRVPAPFDEAYERWKKEFGVGPAPTLSEAVNVDISSLAPSGIGESPSQPGPFGQGGAPLPAAPSVPANPEDEPPISGITTFAPGISKKGGGSGDIWNKVLYGATVASYLPMSPAAPFRMPLTAAAIAESQGIDVTGMAGKAMKAAGSALQSFPGKVWEGIRSRKAAEPLADNSKIYTYVGPTRTMANGQKWYWNGKRYVPPESMGGDGWMGRVPRSYAQGGRNIPGGPILVGEQGPEHIVTPQGQVVPVGQEGPQMAVVPDGVDVLPADVPPEQAYLYAKLKQMMQEDLATRDARRMAEAEQRRNDPNFEQNFREAVARAAAAILAADPPSTPQLVGEGWTFDPYYYERQLSGVGADGLPLAQSQMLLPPDPRRQARMEEIQQMLGGAGP